MRAVSLRKSWASSEDLAPEERWHLCTEDFSEQRMAETDAWRSLAFDGNQSSPLEFYQDVASRHRFRTGESQRFSD